MARIRLHQQCAASLYNLVTEHVENKDIVEAALLQMPLPPIIIDYRNNNNPVILKGGWIISALRFEFTEYAWQRRRLDETILNVIEIEPQTTHEEIRMFLSLYH